MTTRIIETQGTATNRKKCTFSGWIKRGQITNGDDQVIFDSYADGSNRMTLYFVGTDHLGLYGSQSGSTILNFQTTQVFRDVNAWYHISFQFDTTQSTNTDRFKLYVNGERVMYTSGFSTETYPNQNTDLPLGSGYTTGFGWYGGGGSSIFHGSMSHLHFTDGYAYASSSFGSTDSSTGEWKINTSPSVTYGNNGFFILKDGNSLTDQSPNTNNFSVATGTLTKTEDNPSNVFCTMNPLSHRTSWTLSNGNNTFNGGTVTDWKHGCGGTLGASSGKYYWEAKWTSGDSYSIIGVLPIDQYWRCGKGDTSQDVYGKSNSLQLSASNSGDKYNYVSSNGSGIQRTINDILMFAIDFDNKKMWVGENGVWDTNGGYVGNPANGTYPTWDTSEFNSDWDSGFVPFCQSYKISAVTEFQFNFGNGYFGTTAVSSAGTNASGNGIFEYDVPTGFTALSTKGLNL